MGRKGRPKMVLKGQCIDPEPQGDTASSLLDIHSADSAPVYIEQRMYIYSIRLQYNGTIVP